ncbi:MAG TPA: hypothetical protein VGK73_22510 [Polyangiaceae bacterium]
MLRAGAAFLAFTFVAVACSSEELVESGAGAGSAGRGGAGGGGIPGGSSGGGAGGRAGSSGETGGSSAGGAGEGGERAGGGEAGSAEAGGAGAPSSLGYRLTGSASADVSGDGGAAGDGSAAAGASGSGDAGAAGSSELPIIDRVECSIAADVLDVVEDESGGFSAVAVGEVFRNVYSGGRRWEFSAFIAGPATLRAGPGSSVELRAVGDQTGAKPFWRELEVLEGERNGPGAYSGVWTCSTLALADPGFPEPRATHQEPGSSSRRIERQIASVRERELCSAPDRAALRRPC